MGTNSAYSITTQKLRLRCRHPEWLRTTQALYNRIEYFYYTLLLDHPDLWQVGSHQALRELEILSIPGRDKREVEAPLTFGKVPVYFRRSAANAGIAAAKSYIVHAGNRPCRRAESLNTAVVYYKGMYRDFSSSQITLKVWDGEAWRWMHCSLSGKEFPPGSQTMSPSVVFGYRYIMVHVPVKEYGGDASTLKERLASGRNLCSIQFSNSDSFAICSVCDMEGKELAVKFFTGGKEYAAQCARVMEKLEKSCRSIGHPQPGKPNQKYWMKLQHLSEGRAHQVSAGIINFCKENEVTILVVPRYREDHTKNLMAGAGNWSPFHLSAKIRWDLRYKAWKNGMLFLETDASGISSSCAKCGCRLLSTEKNRGLYLCENGHQGNRYLNAARNLGLKFLSQSGITVQCGT